MKTIPTASSAATPSPSSPASTAAVRPSTSSPRPASTVDYRANVERQSREQKSVGSILSYVVYGLIALFLLTAGLAGYGAKVIFARLHDQSQTVTDLDTHYAAANKDLTAKLASTQDTLTQAQAQIARQQDLILRQQDALNKLIAATNDNTAGIQREKEIRSAEASNLRARIREVDARIPTPAKY